MHRGGTRKSALVVVLKALIPYSRENLLLSFSPNKFFNELEKSSGYKKSTLRNAHWRGQQSGLIEKGSSALTDKGLAEVRPFIANRLGKDAKLMVIFDIPEADRAKRQALRYQLKLWDFEQIQKSVWVSDLDYRNLLIELLADLKLTGYVEMFEASRLFP